MIGIYSQFKKPLVEMVAGLDESVDSHEVVSRNIGFYRLRDEKLPLQK